MKKKIIIIANASPINRLWEYRLKTDGHEVKVIDSCEDAIDYLRNHKVDLAIVVEYSFISKDLNLIYNFGANISDNLPMLSIIESYDNTFIDTIDSKRPNEYMEIPFRAAELSFRVNRLFYGQINNSVMH